MVHFCYFHQMLQHNVRFEMLQYSVIQPNVETEKWLVEAEKWPEYLWV